MEFKNSLDRLLFSIDNALRSAYLVTKPFPHFTLRKLFDDATADAVLDWFEEDAPWTVETSKFYIQHGCGNLVERIANTPAADVGAPQVFHLIRTHLERIFSTALSPNEFRIEAHRLLPNHRIGIHNDNPSGGSETHRLVLTFNREFDDSYGGQLALVDIHNPSESITIISPEHGCAVAMELSANSWHCVDEVRAGTRYSLLYSFWRLATGSSSEYALHPDASDAKKHVLLSRVEHEALFAFLRECGADKIHHTSRFLIDHLVGTFEILLQWGCDSEVCKAGLFHSVLGTPSVPRPLVPEGRTDHLRAVIGERAFFLVHLFSSLDGPTFERIMAGGKLSCESGHVSLDAEDVRAVATLTWANILEQSSRVQQSDEECGWMEDLYQRSHHLLPEKSHDDIRRMFRLS